MRKEAVMVSPLEKASLSLVNIGIVQHTDQVLTNSPIASLIPVELLKSLPVATSCRVAYREASQIYFLSDISLRSFRVSDVAD